MATPAQDLSPAATTYSSDQIKLMAEQLGRLIDLYKHHFDLFLKGVAGYLAVLGFIGSAINNSQTTHQNRIVLSVIVSLASAFGIVGGVISRRWVHVIRNRMEILAGELHLPAPLSSAENIVVLLILYVAYS